MAQHRLGIIMNGVTGRMGTNQHLIRSIAAIRAEEDLATSDHSMVAVEKWDLANFSEEDSRNIAKAARQEYQDALRQVLYNF